MPETCFRCGGTAEDSITWQTQAETEIGDPATRALARLFGMGGILGLLQLVGQKRAKRIKLLIPCCAECKRFGTPQAVLVDFDSLKATFIVHRSFWGRILFYRSERDGQSDIGRLK